MKVKSAQPGKLYAPVKLLIELETEEEAEQFYFLFNHSNLTCTLSALNADAIRDEMEKQGFKYSCKEHGLLRDRIRIIFANDEKRR